MMKGAYLNRFVASALVLGSALACESASERDEDVGVAELTLLDAPPGVGCIKVTAAGSRVVDKEFNVGLGSHTQYTLNGLPMGSLLFSAEAYDAFCSNIAGATPSWTGGPVTAVVAANAVTPVTIPMKRNGKADVSVDFDDPICAQSGEACTTDAGCCAGPNVSAVCSAGVCVQQCFGGFGDCNENGTDGCETSTFSDIENCGACGLACPFACETGFCLDSSLTVDGVSYYGRRMIDSLDTAGITAPLVDGGLCDTIDPAWAGQIVLCLRGNISFALKGQNVAASGGLAAVVYNHSPGYIFGTLAPLTAGVPVIGFNQDDGTFLVANEIGATATLVAF